MVWVLRLVKIGAEAEGQAVDIMEINRPGDIADLGLTLAETKRLSARLQQEIQKYYQERGLQISPQTSDLSSLTENLASVLAPLYADIHSTSADALRIAQAQPQLVQKAAQP